MRHPVLMLALLLFLATAGCASRQPKVEPQPPAPQAQEPAASEQAVEEREPRIMLIAEQGVRLYSQAGSFKSILEILKQGEAVIWLESYRDMVRVKVVRTGEKGWVQATELLDQTAKKEENGEEKPPPPPPPTPRRQSEPKFILTF